MAKIFIRRYRGEEEVKFLHPALKPILYPTQGVLLFQEQILRIAREIAGLTWEQADGLRKGMSKFQPEEMAAIKQDFIAGCQRSQPEGPGFLADQAKTLWDQVSAFAGYGFNKGHATAYADVSYRSAYLKTHYPAEFMCARLADRGGFHHPAIYMAEAKRLGIVVQPPHINASHRAFSLTYGYPPGIGKQNDNVHDAGLLPILWMGLGQVRDLRKRSVQNIVSERKNGPYSSLAEFLARVSLQEKEIRHLIQCGALDRLGISRSKMLADLVSIEAGWKLPAVGL